MNPPVLRVGFMPRQCETLGNLVLSEARLRWPLESKFGPAAAGASAAEDPQCSL